ncbi:MAG: immunodominant staphylococcal antigen IsaB family protein [Staphylococcus saprophyticus]
MNKKLLVLSSTVAATGFLVGAGNGVIGNNTAHADTMNPQENNMNNNMQQQAMPMENDMAMDQGMNDMQGNMNHNDMAMDQGMNDMQGNMNHNDMAMDQGMNDMQGNMMKGNMEEAMMPYYNYTGYTTYEGHFTQDYDFVRALKYDNVMIDGYKVNTATNDKDVATSKKVNDTMVDMNKDGQVVNITFDTKADTVSKAMFKKAHMSNHMSDEGQTENGSYITYETNHGMYTAHFDEQGFLMKVMIS